MKSKTLARWLQEHTQMLGTIDDPQDQAFHTAMYEGIIDMASSGESRMLDSILESVAAHAVAVGRNLTDLLGVHQNLRQRIWQRIGEEIDPEPAFAMLSALDEIFVHIIRVTIDAYQENTHLAMAAKSTEISRLYTESEQRVLEYATEMSRANRELARLEQAKTDFISIAAHELKTPLTLIQGYVDILVDLNPQADMAMMIDGIGRGVQRMNNILDNMLDLSALDLQRMRLVLQKVNLKKLIELTVLQSQRALDERHQCLSVSGLETLPEIEADANRIHQILKQILSNAIKYTPDGGQISIAGESSSSLSPTGQPNNFVRIVVSDAGVGIAPEDQTKIFEKFYRASDSSLHSSGQTKFMGAGPGLGLAIVKGLTEAHGGRVYVESPGFDSQNYPGSTFVVELPFLATPPPGIEVQWLARGGRQPDPPAHLPATLHNDKDNQL